MKKNSYKWGILGPGTIAKKFAMGLEKTSGAEFYAVASRTIGKARNFASEFGAAKAYGSYEEMLQDKEVDVVYIATPHAFHFEHTLLCLKRKKAVVCEKPFAINKAQVEQMIATAKKEKVFLMEGMWTCFLPHFEYVLDLIKTEKYGKLKNLKADFGFKAPFNREARLFNKALGGGSLLDIGIYPVFMALSCLGIPEKIEAKANLGRTAIDEDCEIIFHYPGGIEAELHSSISKKTPTTATLLLEKATITLNSRFHEPTSVNILTEKGEETKEFDIAANGFEFEAAHVQEMLKQGRIESDKMSFDKSLKLIALLDEVREKISLEY